MALSVDIAVKYQRSAAVHGERSDFKLMMMMVMVD